MKLRNPKTWLPGMILGISLLSAVPVSADITNSGSTPPEQFERLSSTDDSAVNSASQNSDDSGNVYDFKDSKTSGVVVVTKTWEDSLSNGKRPVPDISISTVKPSKSALGYGITYHGNGLTFANGSKINDIVVNKSGKIISGQYKELSGSLGWYIDSGCTNKIEVDVNGLPTDGVNSDLDLYAKPKTFVLKSSKSFNKLISDSATSIVFTDEIMPASAELIDVDADGDNGVVAWMDGTTMKISTQTSGKQVIISSCADMFYYKRNITEMNLFNIDTSAVTNMSGMFYGCSGLSSLDLSHMDTSKVTDMSWMFSSCGNLISLNLLSFDTSKVTDMHNMFYFCSNLKSLNLSSFNTKNVTNMQDMFSVCSNLSILTLGNTFTFVGSGYYLPTGTWYASDGIAYTSTTIPNNKADTYTRK